MEREINEGEAVCDIGRRRKIDIDIDRISRRESQREIISRSFQ